MKMFSNIVTKRIKPLALGAAVSALAVTGTTAATAAAAPRAAVDAPAGHAAADGLGQLSGFLSPSKFTVGSLIDINLSNESARLPIYPGTAPNPLTGKQETVWYILLDASDSGLAADLGVNFAPKLANIGIGCPACVETVTEANPTPTANPFGPAVIHFAGAPDFSPTRIAVPGPTGFPLAKFQPGSVAGPGYSPFIKIAGSDVVYNAPIVASGDGPFDVVHH